MMIMVDYNQILCNGEIKMAIRKSKSHMLDSNNPELLIYTIHQFEKATEDL